MQMRLRLMTVAVEKCRPKGECYYQLKLYTSQARTDWWWQEEEVT